MSYVLIVNSQVVCPHAPGKAAVSSSTKLTVDGVKVLVLAGVQGVNIGGCSQPTDTSKSTQTCLHVTTATGTANKLTAGGQPVVLDTLSGFTDGSPPPPTPTSGPLVSVASVGQIKLTAV
jgi:hypothetical protein